MSKKTFRIVSGITTAVSAAVIGIIGAVGPDWGTLACTITAIVAGAIDEVCTLFIKEE